MRHVLRPANGIWEMQSSQRGGKPGIQGSEAEAGFSKLVEPRANLALSKIEAFLKQAQPLEALPLRRRRQREGDCENPAGGARTDTVPLRTNREGGYEHSF